MPHQEFFIRWLADAYGMESALVTRLGNQLSDMTSHKELEAKLLEHLDRTSSHANMVQDCIARLGGATSSLDQGGLPHLMDTLQRSRIGAGDGVLLKTLIGDIAAESFEIATYKTLIAAAQQIGDQQTAEVCQLILRDEQEMARWLTAYVPMAVKVLLRPETAPGANEDDLPIDKAGTLQEHTLYAAFEGEQQARQAEEALAAGGTMTRRLQGSDSARHLRLQAEGSGDIAARVERTLKQPLGETGSAEHYAIAVESGHIVLAVPCADHAQAARLTRLLKEHGAYELSYFSGTGMEHMRQ